MLKECEETKDETPVEEFLKGDGKSYELMKRIDIIRKKEKEQKKGDETSEDEGVM